MKRLKYFALAALVAFAACDEGDEVVTPTPVTGTISGVVTIDGSGAQGVTVTLSSGATATTGANGSYTISNVAAGAYTVTISGFPSDAAFSSTSKAATITTAGQVVPVDFTGNFITTSAIAVSVGGPQAGSLSGATVSLSGGPSAPATATTGVAGTVNFSGLRAGTYTVSVALSAGDAALYDLNTTSQSVTVGLDELASVSFTATPKTISTISGRLFIDEASKNNLFDENSEENLTVANIQIVVEGIQVGVFDTIQTDANGEFEVTGLPAANYRVILNDTDPQIPGAVAFSADSNNEVVFTLGVADAEVLNFPFDIVEQQITVGAFLGADESDGPAGVASRVTPIGGIGITLYPTQADATNLTNALASGSTVAGTGLRTLAFDREDDTDPLGGPSDNIVFARVTGGIPGTFTQNGETIIEIPFQNPDSLAVAADVFDFLNSEVTVSFRIQETDADRYNGLRAQQFTDTTAADLTAFSNASGLVYYDLSAFDEYFFTFNETVQDNLPQAGIPNWPSPVTLSIDPDEGGSAGSFLTYDFDGTVLPTDTVFVGTVNLSWDQIDIRGKGFREFNDTLNFQGSDGFTNVDNMSVQLQFDNSGTWTNVGGAVAPDPVAQGEFEVSAVQSGRSYRFSATPSSSIWAVLTPAIVAASDTDGSDQVVDVCPLRATGTTSFATCGTFAMKLQNNQISGTVLYRDGTPAPNGTEVRVMTDAARTIQGRASTGGDTIVTVSGGAGAFATNMTVREGHYLVMPVSDDDIEFFAAVNGGQKSVHVESALAAGVNVGVATATPARSTLAGGASPAASFHGYATTSIAGVIINDRDEDGNTIDNNEALVGVEVSLFRDDTGGFTESADSLVATAITGADGSYLFEDLLEGRFRVTVESAPAEAVVLNNDRQARLDIVTEAGDPDKGDTSPTPLPFWDYQASDVVNPGTIAATSTPAGEWFTFLFTNGTARGTVTNGGSGVATATVTIRRCLTETDDPLTMPAAGTCDVVETGTFGNMVTGTDGVYQFDDLREGIYEIEVIEEGAGFTTGGAPFLIFVDGANDLEVVNFTIS